nr:MAG TPA: DNA-directed RNA polymerase subunit alpha [Caudoviricetes sp.]
MKKYTVYTFRSKRGCEAYIKTHSIEEALELARKAGENVELTDLRIL